MSSRARSAGLLIPLFALRSARDWGIGEIGDVPALCRWIARAGHRLLQLLPIVEMAPGERSPYAAMTAFAIDPIYLSLDAIEDVVATGGREAAADAIAAARADPDIDYDGVRRAKRDALERAFVRFVAMEWETGSARAADFRRFRDDEAAWLGDYALFRVLQERYGSWTGWEPGLRDRRPEAIAAAADALARERLFHEWVQWIASAQWRTARGEAAAAGVRLKGDLPFMVSASSADVWARQGDFVLDAEIGAPPDAFNAEGQRWGLPPCRWEPMAAAGDLAWLRARARRAAALFDAFRVDHVVGFYRQYVLPPGRFVPADEDEQLALGERLLRALRESAGTAEVIGEDLGVVPRFVRASLARLGIPGYRVLRWEDDGGVFRDPTAYPARSVATSGTHDISTLATWWEDELGDAGRRALARVPAFAPLAPASATFTPAVHGALLDGLYAAASDLVVLPLPDAYGGRERINVPATVGRTNWAYRLPWTVEELGMGAAGELRTKLRMLAERHGRA